MDSETDVSDSVTLLPLPVRVSDIAATVAAAKAAGAKVDRDVATVSIGGAPIKIAMLVDPQGNALEIMELPKALTHLPH